MKTMLKRSFTSIRVVVGLALVLSAPGGSARAVDAVVEAPATTCVDDRDVPDGLGCVVAGCATALRDRVRAGHRLGGHRAASADTAPPRPLAEQLGDLVVQLCSDDPLVLPQADRVLRSVGCAGGPPALAGHRAGRSGPTRRRRGPAGATWCLAHSHAPRPLGDRRLRVGRQARRAQRHGA